MKSRISKSVVGLAILFALAMASTITPAFGQSAKAEDLGGADTLEFHGRKLEGTWRVRVTIRDCQSGAALRMFPALLTFAEGGTLTETTTGFSPALRTPGHGFWRRVRGQAFTAVSEAFLFNPAGVWVGTQRITQNIQFGDNSDEFESAASIEIFDTNGNPTATGCATAIANRME